MSTDKRVPGPVDAEAKSIHMPTAAVELQERRKEHQSEQRTPGPVTELTEAMEEKSEAEADDDSQIMPRLMTRSPWKTFFVLLVITFFVWLLSQVAGSLVTAYHERVVWIWVPMAVVSAGLLTAFLLALRREYRAIRSVDALANRELEIQAMLANNNLYGLRKVLEPTLKNLRRRYPELIREFETAAVDRDTPGDYLKQLDNIVLTKLDKKAEKVINNCVVTGSLAVAISPHPALDSFFVLWRARILIRSVAEIYGLQPTGLSAVRLIKHAITSAMIAALMENSGEFIAARVAENLAMKILKPVTEGAVTAARLYRLGYITLQVCRPVPMKKSAKREG